MIVSQLMLVLFTLHFIMYGAFKETEEKNSTGFLYAQRKLTCVHGKLTSAHKKITGVHKKPTGEHT